MCLTNIKHFLKEHFQNIILKNFHKFNKFIAVKEKKIMNLVKDGKGRLFKRLLQLDFAVDKRDWTQIPDKKCLLNLDSGSSETLLDQALILGSALCLLIPVLATILLGYFSKNSPPSISNQIPHSPPGISSSRRILSSHPLQNFPCPDVFLLVIFFPLTPTMILGYQIPPFLLVFRVQTRLFHLCETPLQPTPPPTEKPYCNNPLLE